MSLLLRVAGPVTGVELACRLVVGPVSRRKSSKTLGNWLTISGLVSILTLFHVKRDPSSQGESSLQFCRDPSAGIPRFSEYKPP